MSLYSRHDGERVPGTRSVVSPGGDVGRGVAKLRAEEDWGTGAHADRQGTITPMPTTTSYKGALLFFEKFCNARL